MTKEQAAQSQAFFNEAKQHLRKLARVQNPDSSSYWSRGYFPQDTMDAGGGTSLPQGDTMGPGWFNVKYGQEPSDADVQQFIDRVGGNPFEPRSRATVTNGAPGPAGKESTVNAPPKPKEGESVRSVFEKLMTDFQSKIDEANAANDARYTEGKGLYTDLRDRNQSRVGNWGIAAQQDIDQRMKASLGDAAANLASRGLAGTGILDSYRLNAANSTAREQQRVSEMRDSRASEYDTRDTGALAGFIERRNDIAPDPSMLVSLADRIGQSDAAKVANDLRSRELDIQGQQYAQQPQIPYYPAPLNPNNYRPQFLGTPDYAQGVFAQPGAGGMQQPQSSAYPYNRYAGVQPGDQAIRDQQLAANQAQAAAIHNAIRQRIDASAARHPYGVGGYPYLTR